MVYYGLIDMAIGFLGKKRSSFQIIIIGFLGLILTGTVLLILPAAVKDGGRASVEDALFTSTSAVCVTGLVVKDTATYWSAFGQTVILILIQIGGLGIVSVAAFVAMISGRKITLFQRSTLQDSISAHQIGGLVKMTGFIFKVALIFEIAGALVMLPVFCGMYGTCGIWMSLFHSVSAFCNAGFDIMGEATGQFSSLTSFAHDARIVIPICILIITGGIGFLTWEDIAIHKLSIHRYRMQSKVVITTTALLIIVPMLLLYMLEYTDGSAENRFLLSLFQTITPRTAGFNTAQFSSLSDIGCLIFIILMLIGGSPGSAAGGMKTTTVAVLCANAIAVFGRKKNVEMFGRRLEDAAIRSATTLFVMYLILPLLCASAMSIREGLPFKSCIFEAASAIGTVGLSLGITPDLGLFSHLILIMLMFFGRVGGLTMIYAAISSRSLEVSKPPVEKINVG